MARGEAEKVLASGAMRAETAPQHPKCHEIQRPARGGYWMACGDYLFSVALIDVHTKARFAVIERAVRMVFDAKDR